MSNEVEPTSMEEEFGYDVMNATTNITTSNIEDLYYCELDTSKTKECNNLPNYLTLVKVTIAK